jgi:DNA-binding response OmpR family regulator
MPDPHLHVCDWYIILFKTGRIWIFDPSSLFQDIKRSDKIELSNGVYFDEYRDQFFKKGGVLIDFTRLEKGFLKLLIERRDEITDYDTIKELVWKGKDMSIYTMRNIVNKIRQKTYYEIVKNHSSRGYTIDILKK